MGKSKKQATAVGILGMHRSGTSLLTRIVNLLGAYIGEPDEMMQAGPDNPEGFWEHQRIYDLHERILDALGRSWDTAIPLPADWQRSSGMAGFRDELGGLVETRFRDQALWAWKDPRSCILLPLWKDVLAERDIDLRCLLVNRNPLDVARSLQKRNGFALNTSFGIWFNHSLAMLQNSAGTTRTIAFYDRFLADPESSVSSWAPRLALRWAPRDKKLRDSIRQAVHKDLRHGVSTLRDLSKAGCPKPVIELARILNAMAKTADVDDPVHEPKIMRLLDAHVSLSGLYSHDFSRVRDSNSELADRLAELENRRREQEDGAEPVQQVEELQGQLVAAKQEFEDVRTRLEVAERQLQERQSEVIDVLTERADLERALVEARKRSETAERKVQARDMEFTGVHKQLVEDGMELAAAHARRETVERTLQERNRELRNAQVRLAEYEKDMAAARVQCDTAERLLESRDRELNDARERLASFEDELVAVRIRQDTLEQQVQARDCDVSHARGQANEYKERLAETSSQWDATTRELDETRKAIADYEQQLDEIRGVLAERESALEEVRGKADEIWAQLLAEREQAEARLASLERQHSEARSLVEERDEKLRALQQTADQIWMQLESERADTKARFDRFYATYSWRVTSPLRAVFDALTSTGRSFKSLRRKLTPTRPAPQKEIRPETAIIPAATPRPEAGDAPRLAAPAGSEAPKLIAFYLPQFHPIPENDAWWGKGFTEWTNVAKARPMYDDHHQPRRPADLGYYDLRIPEVREAQAELAQAFGIHGFCYHYYWFDGRRVLERPLDDMLASGRPDFPFCLCWANESWTRRWDGSEQDILIQQDYSEGFAGRFAEDVVPYLKDRRYIRIGDRPLLIVYRLDQIPDPEQAIETWRQVFRDRGVGEVLLGAVECFDITNPTRFGFDVAIEFPPHNPPLAETRFIDPIRRKRIRNLDPEFTGTLRDYRHAARARSGMKPTGYPLFRGVMPSWDNTARTGTRGMIYHHASPETYQEWLATVLASAADFAAPHEPVVFVNAWNEWAEGAYLEPDERYGHAYLEATKAAVDRVFLPASAPDLGGAGREQKSPEVSIVIPAFNNSRLTRACLQSLAQHETSVPFEVLVIDDASTDDTPSLRQEMPWLRYFRQEENGGFGAACNFGASQAQGEYLVFLNNDTTVCDGWLDSLRATFEDWPGAGLVGSKLVLMDGTMQECGGLLFRDGSPANYGRGGDPRDPRYCYTRESDYVSGAAIMIRKHLFDDLQGFDDIFAPAYYEDTDLAMRVREKGLKVIVNPHAEVRHVEGGTAGTDLTTGIKRYQVINQEKFFERWKDTLSDFPERPAGEPGLAKTGPNVLVIDWIVPRPDRDSGSLRMTGILHALRDLDCHVTVAARDMSCEAGYELPLERIGIEVLRSPYNDCLDKYLGEHGSEYDFVIVSRRDTATMHIDSIERHCPRARIVFDTCDLHFIRESRQASLGDSKVKKRELESMKAVELDLIRRSHTTLVVSPEERDVLKQTLPGQDVRIVSNILDFEPTARPYSERSGLLFIGWFLHTPNLDGVLWFIREVLPELANRGLEPEFHVVGSDPPPELLALGSEKIRIHGYVPDVEPLFDSCRLSVAPLRYGAGVKGKINQSMALGVPCVTTSIGAEGVFIEDGFNGMVADDAGDFASRIEAAYQSGELWSKLRDNGLKNIEEHFSPKVATDVLRGLIFEPSQNGQSSAVFPAQSRAGN